MQSIYNLGAGNSEASGEGLLAGWDPVDSGGRKRHHIQETVTNWIL